MAGKNCPLWMRTPSTLDANHCPLCLRTLSIFDARGQYSSNRDRFLFEICAVDDRTAWATGRHFSGDPPAPVLKTADGNTWKALSVDTVDKDINGFSGIDAVDSNTAWVVGSLGSIFKTIDGGENWERQASGTTYPLRNVSAIDEHTVWAFGYMDVLRSTDGGRNWASIWRMPDKNKNGLYYAGTGADLHNAWLVGDWGTIVKIYNDSISERQESVTESKLIAVTAKNKDQAWIAGYDGTILNTVDGGKTWTVQDSGTNKEISGISVVKR